MVCEDGRKNLATRSCFDVVERRGQDSTRTNVNCPALASSGLVSSVAAGDFNCQSSILRESPSRVNTAKVLIPTVLPFAWNR